MYKWQTVFGIYTSPRGDVGCFGVLQVGQMVTLQASHQGATLHMYEGITMQEINHRSASFKSALSEVVQTQSRKSNMLLPPAPPGRFPNFFMPKQDIRKRMKMQFVVTQALYAERHVSFTANSKGATISMDLAKLAGAASLGAGAMVSTIATTPTATINLTAHTTGVTRSESQVGLNLVAYALQAFNCRPSGECWEVENIEHSFLTPSSERVSPLDSIWS